MIVGVDSTKLDRVYAVQRNTMWCWAATLQMLFGYHGIRIEQEEIVYRSFGRDPYGNPPNWPGSFEMITRNLNNWSIDHHGRRYRIQAHLGGGAPETVVLIQELARQHPVILSYQSRPTMGHAVLCTAADYIVHHNQVFIRKIIVRDPWPIEKNLRVNGRLSYHGAELAHKTSAHWIVRVQFV